MGKREYEIVVHNKHIDMNEFKSKLKKIGGSIVQKEQIFYYIVYEHPLKKKNYYIRIRSEGNQLTMTVKTNTNDKYPIENEITIDNFKEANKILLELGCKKKFQIHKLREVWKIKDCKEIVFDTYPGMETYAEIECDTPKNIQTVLKKLNLDTNLKNYPRFPIAKYYLDTFGIKPKKKYNDLTFTTAYTELLKRATKNKSILKKRLDYVNKKHKKQINELKNFLK